MTYKPTKEAVEKLVNIIDASNPYAQNIALDILAAIHADLSVFFPVKELVWSEWGASMPNTWYAATGMFGVDYVITSGGHGASKWFQVEGVINRDNSSSTLDLAKAAAQTHYAALADGVRV